MPVLSTRHRRNRDVRRVIVMAAHTNSRQHVPRRTRPFANVVLHIKLNQVRHHGYTLHNHNRRSSQVGRSLIRNNTISNMSTDAIINRRRSLRHNSTITRRFLQAIPNYVRPSVHHNAMNIKVRVPVVKLISVQLSIVVHMFDIRTNPLITNHLRVTATYNNYLVPG